MKIKLTFLLSFFLISTSWAQEYMGIKYTGNSYESKCKKCLDVLASMPQEVQFGTFRDDDWNLYFSLSDVRFFEELFKGSGDGVAIDIINKNQISCTGENSIANSWLYMGKLVPPVFLKEMKASAIVREDGNIIVPVGKVPTALRGQELEYNLIIVKNKYLCYYQRFYDLARYRWDLLDMGLYMDSIEYGIQYDTSSAMKDRASFMQTRMKFVVPFEKNKWSYKAEDIQPFYDSLKLENFNIKRIEIRAYASVEGSEEKNEELQRKRAESIIAVLQEKQLMQIEQVVHTSENWVEFYNDVTGTKYSGMARQSKEQVKERLQDKATRENLEPILAKERKAVIILDVERKTSISESREEMVAEFQKAIAEENNERALDLQRSIFMKIVDHELPEDVINDLEIPRQLGYGELLNNQAAFEHFLHPEEILETYKEFKELDILIPKNKRIRYNLLAMKFRVWLMGLEDVNPEVFEKEIKDLKRIGISSRHVRRMLINYNIIMSEYYFFMGDYTNKDASLSYIKKNYRYVTMSDADLLSLAQYFASYARFDWATSLLLPYVKRIDCNEDLLFYYINLTIADDAMLKRDSYKQILLNAISINRTRYCHFFDPIEKGGASFQLLLNDKLKDIYCQDCSGIRM